ncbi:MAG: hypothetical protein KDC76_03015 [Bacteroidetes bacterium]|nr:hypothetical protein [Bacteroidota bacterium]
MSDSKRVISALVFLTATVLSGCASYTYSNKSSGEQTTMHPLVFEEPITLLDVVEANNPASSRGLITTDVLIEGANLAIQGVKMMIDKSQEKYIQSYAGNLSNNRFYASNSKIGMLDPDQISFKGFEITRTFETADKDREVAIFARFVLDENKLEDLYFNSKFYLRLDSISIAYSKVKLNDGRWYMPWTMFLKKDHVMNLDLTIDLTTNWISDDGTIHSNIPFGQFMLPLRNIPMNPNDPNHDTYFASLQQKSVAGSSYIIPRSRTFCTNDQGELGPCYGRGDFAINVAVTESSKSDFISKQLNENSDAIFDNLKGEDLIKAIKKD